MELAKSQVAAQSTTQAVEEVTVEDLIDPSAVVRSEDVEQQECFTF